MDLILKRFGFQLFQVLMMVSLSTLSGCEKGKLQTQKKEQTQIEKMKQITESVEQIAEPKEKKIRKLHTGNTSFNKVSNKQNTPFQKQKSPFRKKTESKTKAVKKKINEKAKSVSKSDDGKLLLKNDKVATQKNKDGKKLILKKENNTGVKMTDEKPSELSEPDDLEEIERRLLEEINEIKRKIEKRRR